MLFDSLDNIALSFLIIKNNKIIDCNMNAVNLFNYEKKEELIGLQPYDLSPYLQDDGTESAVKGKEYIKKAKTEKNVNFTWRHTKKNGDTFLAYVNLIEIKNIIFTLITNLDEVQEYEASIKEKDEMYKLLFEENKNMILIIDPITLKINDANRAALDFYGQSLKTKRYIDITKNENIKNNIEEALTNKKNIFYSQHIDFNGEARDVEVHIFAITLNNKDYLIAMIYDTSEKIKQNLIINTFLTQSPYPIAVLDNDQRVININEKFTDLFQYEKEELIGKNLNDLLTTLEYRSELNDNIDKVFTENFIRVNTLRKRKDNSLVNVEIFAFPITYNDKIIGAYVHYIDITEKIKNQSQLELFKKVLENNNEGIMITDTNETIEWVNHAFTKITGYTLEEIQGKTPKILRSEFQSEEFYSKMWDDIRKNHHWHGEVWNKNKQGEIYPEWLNIYAVKTNDVITNYVAIIKDLSESKVIDQKMRILAQKDALTGLYNRVYFTEKVNQLINNQDINEFSILFMDLNRFKEINDTLGHHAGDEFLIEISRRLQTYLDEDTLIARYGGDEFVILLKNCITIQNVSEIAQKVLNIINEPFNYEGNLLYVTASLGISLYPQDGENSDDLIQKADIAMYVSKNSYDKKITYYTPNMRQQINERFKIANMLRESINNKAYSLLFEPVFDLKTNKIMALEVHLEWHNEQLKNHSKDVQIEIALQSGQINQIFDFILTDICKLLTENPDFDIPLSLNILTEQLKQTQFISKLKDKLNNVNTSLIELSLSNNSPIDYSQKVLNTINDLQKLGFKFTLNNFGIDNSSIAQLQYYQIRQINLSSSLINTISSNKTNYNLVKIFHIISQEMNISLIAKGITSENELNLIKQLNLDGAQGIYLSKALTFNEVKNIFGSLSSSVGK